MSEELCLVAAETVVRACSLVACQHGTAACRSKGKVNDENKDQKKSSSSSFHLLHLQGDFLSIRLRYEYEQVGGVPQVSSPVAAVLPLALPAQCPCAYNEYLMGCIMM